MTLNKPRSIIRLAEIYLEGVLVLRELRQVLFGYLFFNALFLGRVHQGDAGALEAGTGKAAAIDAIGSEHGLINGDEFRAAAFITVDAGFTGGFGETSKPFQVAGLPGSDAFADALVLGVKVVCSSGEAGRHLIPITFKRGLRNITQESFVVSLQRDVLVSLYDPGSGFAFRHTKVVVARYQTAGKATEEDAQLELRHVISLRNETILVALAVQHEKMVFLSQRYACLV